MKTWLLQYSFAYDVSRASFYVMVYAETIEQAYAKLHEKFKLTDPTQLQIWNATL